MLKIAIATPAYGQMFYAPYVQSLFRLVRTFERHQWRSSFNWCSYAEIVESRNFLLTQWFDKTDASHLLFLDADMGFSSQLIVEMIRLDKPLVGVIYPKREVDLERLVKLAAEGRPADQVLARAHDFIVRREKGSRAPEIQGFIEVDGCGAGIMLIKRSCIETMLGKFSELSDENAKASPLKKDLVRLIRAFDPLIVDGTRLSEDLSFCQRWRQCGGEVWANINHEITHVGIHHFKGRYQDARDHGVHVAAGQRPPLKVVTGRVSPLTSKDKG